jgi:hypothetical protein
MRFVFITTQGKKFRIKATTEAEAWAVVDRDYPNRGGSLYGKLHRKDMLTRCHPHPVHTIETVACVVSEGNKKK